MAEQKAENRNPQNAEQPNRNRSTTESQRDRQSGAQESRGLARRSQGTSLYPSIFSVTPGEFFTLSPISLMRRFTEDIDRAFGFSPGDRALSSPEELGWTPRIEVQRSGDNVIVHAELPGVKENDVRLEVSDEGLAIEGERKREQTSEEKGWHRSEFSYGHFYRLIPLPENASIDQAQANFRNGVLEVTVPAPEAQNKRRQIPIRASGESQGSQSSSSTEEHARTASGSR